VLLVLLLAMLPLGSAACNVHCGVTAIQTARHSLVSQAHADHGCCHASHATAGCTLSPADDASAAVLARDLQVRASLTVAAVATAWVEIATGESAARPGIDSSPPGSETARNQIPLRI
jgi:hypothetical protein